MASNITNVAALRPRRTAFNLSYRKNFTCDMGQLIPVMFDEAVPGDSWRIGNQVVVRFQPLAAPIMHEIECSVHYFFVPYRILWRADSSDSSTNINQVSLWEKFIQQGNQPTYVGGGPTSGLQLDLMVPTHVFDPSIDGVIGSLWDHFGMPPSFSSGTSSPGRDNPVNPNDWPWRAYNRIYNEYYRDQDLQLPVFENYALTQDPDNPTGPQIIRQNRAILWRNWRKDYFTSARPFLQKGTPPALPVNSTLQAAISGYSNNLNTVQQMPVYWYYGNSNNPTVAQQPTVYENGGGNPMTIAGLGLDTTDGAIGGRLGLQTQNIQTGVMGMPVSGTVQSTTFNVSDLRLAFQLQKWLERNARAGTRYTEFLRAHFGVSPSDSRLDRPEYIGGTKVPIIISEVLQTSQTTSDSQLAQMGGHGLAADSQFAGRYSVQEFGIIMGIMSVMPKPSYQDGINRQWLRRFPSDFYFPEYAHLSEQSIYHAELFWSSLGTSSGEQGPYDTFGYVGQYDEMRIKHDIVSTEMRMLSSFNVDVGTGDAQLSYWNMTRKFDVTAPNYLNSEFITCVPRKDIFLVPSKPGLVVNVQNLLIATRPMPPVAEPGLVDHF